MLLILLLTYKTQTSLSTSIVNVELSLCVQTRGIIVNPSIFACDRKLTGC